MKQKTHHQLNMQLKKEGIALLLNRFFNYRPYTGPAGPSLTKFRRLNEQIGTALYILGIPFKTKLGKEIRQVRALTDADKDETFTIVGRKIVIYDRWGYCSLTDDKCDQTSLGMALVYLAGRKYSKLLTHYITRVIKGQNEML